MTKQNVLNALQQAAKLLPQPIDPTCEATLAEISQQLGTRNRELVARTLIAAGWTKRNARLPSGRTGEVWRMPQN